MFSLNKTSNQHSRNNIEHSSWNRPLGALSNPGDDPIGKPKLKKCTFTTGKQNDSSMKTTATEWEVKFNKQYQLS